MWYTIEERISLNTPGQLDGTLMLFVNDVLYIELHDVNFREEANIKVCSAFLWHFFCEIVCYLLSFSFMDCIIIPFMVATIHRGSQMTSRQHILKILK